MVYAPSTTVVEVLSREIGRHLQGRSQNSEALLATQKLTCFKQISTETAPLQVLWLYTTEHFLRGEKGDKVPRKGEEDGWPTKGAKRKKGACAL